jgi:hypothetical protein
MVLIAASRARAEVPTYNVPVEGMQVDDVMHE